MALGDDTFTVIPSEDVKNIITATMGGDSVQEPVEVILSHNADYYNRLRAYLEALGGLPGNWLYDTLLRAEHVKGLSEALQAEDLYYKLKMVKRDTILPRPVRIAAHVDASERTSDTETVEKP